MKNDILKGLKNIGIALVAALLIVWAGTRINTPWLILIVTPILTGLGAYLITKNDIPKTRTTTTITWAAIGLAAAIGWYIFS